MDGKRTGRYNQKGKKTKKMDVDEMLDIATNNAVYSFKASYILRGYPSNGKTFNSIKRNGHSIISSIGVATLIYGRKNGRFPPWGYDKRSNNRTSLMKWAQEKFGLEEKDAKSVSYLIARKLKEVGNDVYRGLKAPIDTEPAQQVAIQTMQELILSNHKKITSNGK